MSEANEQDKSVPPPSAATEENPRAPWEEIENGRYRPHRIRGSYRGRELG